jgi:acyl-CoA thioester hydrolase
MNLLRAYPVIVEQPVAWGDMDAFGHVNNTIYFRWLENARIAYFRRLDWLVTQLPTGVGPILHSTSLRFRRALVFPDTVSIGASVTHLGEDRVTMEHCIVSHNLQAIAAEGQGIIVLYHYGEQRKASIPDDLRQRILDLQATVNAVPVAAAGRRPPA